MALATALLADLRRMLRDEPGVHLLPRPFAPGIALHALALGLRAMERALDLYLARRRPFVRDKPPTISTLNTMLVELMHGTIGQIAELEGVTLSTGVRRSPPETTDADDDARTPRPVHVPGRSAARRHARLA